MDNAGGIRKKLLVVGLEGLYRWALQDRYEIVGVVDLFVQKEQPDNRDFADDLHRYPMFSTVEEALSRTGPEVAAVLVPNTDKNTIDDETLLLSRGIDVVAHKLRLRSFQDIEKLSEAVRSTEARLFVGDHYRYLGKIRTIKRLLQEGAIGRTEYVVWDCYLHYEVHEWMKSYGHLTLEDLAYHHFSVLHDLLGLHPFSLYAFSYEPSFSKVSSNTVASILAQTKEGYRLHYRTIWSSRARLTDYLGNLLIEGSDGSIDLWDDQITLTTAGGIRKQVPILVPEYDGPWGVYEHLADTYYAEPERESFPFAPFTFEQFKPVMHAIYKAVCSAESGQ